MKNKVEVFGQTTIELDSLADSLKAQFNEKQLVDFAYSLGVYYPDQHDSFFLELKKKIDKRLKK